MDPAVDPGDDASPSRNPTEPSRADKLKKEINAGLRHLLPEKHVISFEQLYEAEARSLTNSRKSSACGSGDVHVRKGAAGEPAVAFTPHDHFGLALSGGGIRSATFNLGVLQALARLRLLPHVDYLATVSGGGYAGGFWTAWLHRHRDNVGTAHFPLGQEKRGGEPAEIRHLREFSRFLLPRIGIFETEFWSIVMTVLGGMIPSLLAALAVLGVAWYVWVAAMMTVTVPGWGGGFLLGVAALLYLTISESLWHRTGKADRNRVETLMYIGAGLASAALVFGLARPFSAGTNIYWAPTFTDPQRTLAIPMVFGVCTVALLLVRIVTARVARRPAFVSVLVGLERAATRMLGATIGLFLLAGIWLLSGLVARWESDTGVTGVDVTATGAVASAGAFAWLKNWLTEPLTEERTRAKSLLEGAKARLKRATPKTLALLVWLLLFILVASLLHRWGVAAETAWMFWAPAVACVAIIALVALLFDPARVGMHDFYRSRIARCYLGASHATSESRTECEQAAENRQLAERPGDDLTLRELREVTRPIHLVCVAANEMSGDHLANLYRGARSAVLSGSGISLGDETARLDDLRLSAALTASAAAFNSQMGRVSMDLGPAVGFLMSALNLRLGLWVPHPQNRFRGRYLLPGRFFLAELIGHSRANAQNLHLSDGNHFENFGLYELVRRHCRYIIVSDCGADPEVAFDDLANVLRRVREDFGVEIELDIAALRPDATRFAQRHAVVGTIHYNGTAGLDKGTILFLKPALTGDEPPDVLQYSTRNREFPHESTGDQFYDEAQWESYRRLGEHAIDSVLGFFTAPSNTERPVNIPDRLFRDARSRWHPEPQNQQDNFLEMSDRCAELEKDLMAGGPDSLKAEFFAEATALAAIGARKDQVTTHPATLDAATEALVLSFLIRVGQIMEDVWLAGDLDRYWSHPLNEGWMNYFRRWAATPSFRRWWPVISSFYGIGLREFVRERFHIGAIDAATQAKSPTAQNFAHLHVFEVNNPAEFFRSSFVARQYLQSRPMPILETRRVFAQELQLLDYRGNLSSERLPVAFVVAREELVDSRDASCGWAVVWDENDLFVPDYLNGSGFLSKMLDGVLRLYSQPKGERCYTEVRVDFHAATGSEKPSTNGRRPGRAARHERVREIEFYKSRGFTYATDEDEAGAITLRLILARQNSDGSSQGRSQSRSP